MSRYNDVMMESFRQRTQEFNLPTLRRAITVLMIVKEYGIGGILRKNLVKEVMQREGSTYGQANYAVHVAMLVYPKNLQYKYSRTVITYHE